MSSPTSLLSLPVRSLFASSGCLVAIWVTNNPSFEAFIRESLFPTWGIIYITTSYWLKLVGQEGEAQMVCDPESPHKKPYEPIIIGRYGPIGEAWVKVMQNREDFIATVPPLHSWKPSLEETLLREVVETEESSMGRGLKKLEIFARELRPGWVSVGDEVLKFQDSRLFHVPPT